MVEYIEIKDPKTDLEKLKKCAECIDAGGLVVFPTETVYGIACRAEKKSLARLDEVKQRNLEKRYTLHIGDKSKLVDFVPTLTAQVKKLLKHTWPGPLTVVFEVNDDEIKKLREKHGSEVVELLYKDNSIGIRCPDEPVGNKLLNLCKYPVVAPSANTAGNPPATDGKEAFTQIGDLVDIVINTGKCKYEKSSTVAKISSTGLKILRVGAYSERRIQKMYAINIVFVCSGNTCRSPMAEALAKKKMAEKLGCNINQLEEYGYNIESAGILAVNGISASEGSIMFCESRGINLHTHRSQRLTGAKIRLADHIFAMSNGHKDAIIRICPQAEQKCMMLIDGQEVDDPIGGDDEAYAACGEMIEKAVNERMSVILNESSSCQRS
ncbi:MAG: threonylcarbamoyl-AMP synthase [Planctomycetaceae bacterium]|nr:threonylcarbamoyl-AMP synthase [Planctomycetaceae bacterium]